MNEGYFAMKRLYVALAAISLATAMAATMAASSAATSGFLFLGGGGS